MPVTPEQSQWFADAFGQLVDNIDTAILGKKPQLRLQAWTKRQTTGDLNTQMTLTLDGAAYSTTRWGDAPPC